MHHAYSLFAGVSGFSLSAAQGQGVGMVPPGSASSTPSGGSSAHTHRDLAGRPASTAET